MLQYMATTSSRLRVVRALMLTRNIVTYKKNKMDFQQIKLYVINASTLGVTTFTNIEMGLKLILLLVTIGYTIDKWIKLKKDKKK